MPKPSDADRISQLEAEVRRLKGKPTANRHKLTKPLIASLEPGKNAYIVWDSELTGFGVRINPSGRRAFVINYRLAGRERRMTIGRQGTYTLGQARERGAQLLRDALEGRDPSQIRAKLRGAWDVERLAEEFLAEDRAKPLAKGTLKDYRALLKLHILPAWRRRPVVALTYEDVAALHRKMRETPTQANRMIALVSALWKRAARWGVVSRQAPNPAHDHDRYPERRAGQRVEPAALAFVGAHLVKEPRSPWVDALVVTALIGRRPSEVFRLRWDALEPIEGTTAALALMETKTGPQRICLPSPAMELVHSQLRISEWVFANPRTLGKLVAVRSLWERVRAAAKIDARVYDFVRHTWVSASVELSISDAVSKTLAGHSTGQDAHARYQHANMAQLLPHAEAVAAYLAEQLFGDRGVMALLEDRRPERDPDSRWHLVIEVGGRVVYDRWHRSETAARRAVWQRQRELGGGAARIKGGGKRLRAVVPEVGRIRWVEVQAKLIGIKP